MDNLKCTYLIIFLISISLSGCGITLEFDDYTKSIRGEIFDSEIRSIVRPDQDKESSNLIELPFNEALYRSLLKNSKLRSLYILQESSQIDIEQAKSSALPRAVLDVKMEMPVNGDSEDSHEVLGGVFLKYDLFKAFNSSNAVLAMEVKQKQVLHKREEIIKNAYYDLLTLLIKIDFKDQETNSQEASLEITNKLLENLKTLNDANLKYHGEVRDWEMKQKDIAWAYFAAKEELSLLKEKLKFMLGVASYDNIKISEYLELFPPADNLSPQEVDAQESIERIWYQREDVRLAEMDLFLAELTIIEAKRKKWPKPFFSIGLGNVLLLSENGSEAFVPIVGASVPLLDMGDARRQVEKAINIRDMAKEKLAAMLRQIVEEVLDAKLQAKLHRERLRRAQDELEREVQSLETKEKLLSLNRTDMIDLCTAKLSKTKAEIGFDKAVFDYRIMKIRMKQVSRDPLQEEMSDDLKDKFIKSGIVYPYE